MLLYCTVLHGTARHATPCHSIPLYFTLLYLNVIVNTTPLNDAGRPNHAFQKGTKPSLKINMTVTEESTELKSQFYICHKVHRVVFKEISKDVINSQY